MGFALEVDSQGAFAELSNPSVFNKRELTVELFIKPNQALGTANLFSLYQSPTKNLALQLVDSTCLRQPHIQYLSSQGESNERWSSCRFRLHAGIPRVESCGNRDRKCCAIPRVQFGGPV